MIFFNNEGNGSNNEALNNPTQKPVGLSENVSDSALALSRKKSFEIVKNEFTSEKRQLLIFLSLFFTLFVVSLTLTLLFFLHKKIQWRSAVEKLEFLFAGPLILPYIFLLLISFLLFLYFSLGLYQLNKEKSFYLTRENYLAKVSEDRIPHFVLSAYKRMLFFQIFFNWIFFFSYFVFAATIAILVLLGDLKDKPFHEFNSLEWMELKINSITRAKEKLIITSVVLGLTLLTHITIFTLAKIKQINLNVIFDIENKVPHERISSFTKKIHIFSIIIILIPFVIIFLIWIFVKRIIKR